MTRPYQLPAHAATDEITLLTESRDALRAIVLTPGQTANALAKASSELRAILVRLAELEKAAPPAENDPIEAIRLKVARATIPQRKRTTK